MSMLRLRHRLRALGIDLEALPPAVPCRALRCAGVEFSFSVVSDSWSVWCRCGYRTGPHHSLVLAISEWNDLFGEEVPLGVEAAYVEVARG